MRKIVLFSLCLINVDKESHFISVYHTIKHKKVDYKSHMVEYKCREVEYKAHKVEYNISQVEYSKFSVQKG